MDHSHLLYSHCIFFAQEAVENRSIQNVETGTYLTYPLLPQYTHFNIPRYEMGREGIVPFNPMEETVGICARQRILSE